MWDFGSTSWNIPGRQDRPEREAPMSTAPTTGTQAVDRAALLVDTVVRADEPVSFVELQEETQLAKSTTSRLLAALERTGLLERTGEGAYVAGRLFWLYATRHDPWEEMVRLAHPTLQRISDETRECVHLSVARGGRVVQVAQLQAQYILGMRDWSDVDVPVQCSALGKVLLAWGTLPMPTGRLETPTERSPRTLDELTRDLATARRRGYTTAVDELEEGLAAVAAPVRGADGDVFAALGVSGPTQRLADSAPQFGALLTARAEELSTQLRRRSRKEGVA
jgi:DNA-binding IclR family transcriptional regulator